MSSSPASAADYRAVQRELARALPRESVASAGGGALEHLAVTPDAPRLISASLLEGGAMRAHSVAGEPTEAFTAFLDGTQASRIIAYSHGFPIVHGSVAAVIRLRRNRRLTTWAHLVDHALYAPQALIAADTWDALTALRVPLRDTTAREAPTPVSSHPFALRDAAVHLVQRDREQLEQRLAERWCARERDPLLIDGGISGSDRVAISGCTVGVVKSHRTLYADGEALRAVLALGLRERSSAVRITSTKRTAVASWYLRLRDPAGHDPMWGLVRIEVAAPTAADERAMSERADEVSRWVLAEVTPLALPDARWDKMVYGVRDCEEFLKAVM